MAGPAKGRTSSGKFVKGSRAAKIAAHKRRGRGRGKRRL